MLFQLLGTPSYEALNEPPITSYHEDPYQEGAPRFGHSNEFS